MGCAGDAFASLCPRFFSCPHAAGSSRGGADARLAEWSRRRAGCDEQSISLAFSIAAGRGRKRGIAEQHTVPVAQRHSGCYADALAEPHTERQPDADALGLAVARPRSLVLFRALSGGAARL